MALELLIDTACRVCSTKPTKQHWLAIIKAYPKESMLTETTDTFGISTRRRGTGRVTRVVSRGKDRGRRRLGGVGRRATSTHKSRGRPSTTKQLKLGIVNSKGAENQAGPTTHTTRNRRPGMPNRSREGGGLGFGWNNQTCQLA